MTCNTVVTYVYAQDVPDEDIPPTDDGGDSDAVTPDVVPPIVPVPEVMEPDIEAPETDIPQTGDTRIVSVVLTTAVTSAAGMLWLLKRERDEDAQ